MVRVSGALSNSTCETFKSKGMEMTCVVGGVNQVNHPADLSSYSLIEDSMLRCWHNFCSSVAPSWLKRAASNQVERSCGILCNFKCCSSSEEILGWLLTRGWDYIVLWIRTYVRWSIFERNLEFEVAQDPKVAVTFPSCWSPNRHVDFEIPWISLAVLEILEKLINQVQIGAKRKFTINVLDRNEGCE